MDNVTRAAVMKALEDVGNKVVEMPRTAMEAAIAKLNGATFIRAVLTTHPDMNKWARVIDKVTGKTVRGKAGQITPCPYSTITKVSSLSGCLGRDYARAMDKELHATGELEEGETFIPKHRKFGKLSDNRMLVTYEGTTYLQLVDTCKQGETVIIADGRIVSWDMVAPYLPIPSDKPVTVFDPKLDNVAAIRWFGEDVLLTD